MIAINLIRGGAPSWSDNGGQEVFCKVLPDRPFGLRFNSASTLPPSLHPRLMERILGKSPLRLILSRTLVCRGCYQETLECGHQLTTYQEFLWDEKAHLVLLEPTAKRRRCQQCREVSCVTPAVSSVAPTTGFPDAVATGAKTLPAGMTMTSLTPITNATTTKKAQSVDEFPSPKKPPQSVRRNEKRRLG